MNTFYSVASTIIELTTVFVVGVWYAGQRRTKLSVYVHTRLRTL